MCSALAFRGRAPARASPCLACLPSSARVLVPIATKNSPLQLAVGLGQIGEFSFVLASALVAAGLLASEVYAAVLATVVVSIGVSSVAARLVPQRMSTTTR